MPLLLQKLCPAVGRGWVTARVRRLCGPQISPGEVE
jgi:hypothetical protein